MPQFTIPVVEYQSARPGTAITPPPTPFVMDDRQLVISMVRSILTVNPDRASRKYMAAIVRPALQFMIEWSSVPRLQVAANFQNVVRDFSQTARIGELAQGVSHAYWRQQRGYIWITDFGPWVHGLTPAYTGKRSPDFVMLNLTNDLAVMEAKGTNSNCHKASMGDALRQCKAAVAHPAFARGFGSVLTLDTGTAHGQGILHIRDPEKKVKIPDRLRYFIFRRSYASWFDIVGDDELANWCRQEINVQVDTRISETRLLQASQNPNDLLRNYTATAIGFDATKIRFELDPLVSEALTSFDSFKRTDWSQLQQRARDREHSMQFPDGTIIVQS